jgi:hypothetical protein
MSGMRVEFMRYNHSDIKLISTPKNMEIGVLRVNTIKAKYRVKKGRLLVGWWLRRYVIV